MECPFCAEQIPSDVQDCPECGRPLDAHEETSGTQGEEDVTHVFTQPPTDAKQSKSAQPEAQGTVLEESAAVGWSMPAQAAAGTSSGAASLQPGSVLGHRYEIEKMLGEGGMGAVYKARDVELERAVALKIIRPELATDPEILQRFKQEIILAREVTHRNVIRIFDLGQAEGIKFISMEFVEGKDLHEILKERGPLPVEEAVEILEQVCLALGEAHEAGVVHRDLKPHNIMIDDQGRVVVMDFGIARSVQNRGMTQTGSVLGTPDYMSPEQVKGEHVDARSDLFALGVIFFQMLSGEVPYEGDSPMAAMYTRTQDRAKSVREVNDKVPGFLASVITRCLEISPQKRYQSARELLQDLEMWRGGTPRGMTVGMRHITTVARSTRRRTWLWAGAALLAAALVLAGVQIISRRQPQEAVEVAAEEVSSVAILPFSNASGAEDVAWLSTGLVDMLLTDVGQSAYLRTISSDRLHQILRDLGMPAGSELDAEDRRRIAEYANADQLIWGQYVKLADQIRIDATVEDVAEQVRTPVKVEAANEGELLGAVEQLADLVRENLTLSSGRIKDLEARAFRPSSDSVTAIRSYTQGLELIREGSNLQAVKQFEDSVAEDPRFALAYSKLAEASLLIGHGQDAEEYSRQAVALAENLPPQERFLILAQDARVTGDLERGVEAYSNLLEYRPNDPDLHYDLGLLYESEGLYDQAQQHYAKTLELDPQNLSALLASGGALALQGDGESALEPLERALSMATQVGNEEAEANALHSLGLAYTALDRLDEAFEHYERSLEIKRRLNDPRGLTVTLNEIAQLQAWAGDYDAAKASYAQALEISREIGDEHTTGMILMNLGDIERDRGNYDEALSFTRQALRIQNNLNDEPFQAVSLNNIGATYYLQGKYDDALVYYHQALEIRKRLDRPTETADTLHNLGETNATMGRFEEAIDYYLEALELRRGAHDQKGTALESYYVGKVFAAQGRYRAALESVAEAASTFRQLDDRSAWFAETLAWNGHLLGLLGLGPDAEPLIDEALALAEERENPWLLTQVLNIEGDRVFYLGDFAAAEPVFERALEVAVESGDPLWELTAKVNLAKTQTQTGRADQAVKSLEAMIEEAETLGLKVIASEAAIRLGIALLGADRTARGQQVLSRALDEGKEWVPPDLRAQGHFLLAESLAKTGNETDAAEHAQAASTLLDEMLREAGSETMLSRSDLAPIQSVSTATGSS